ncbi:MAG: S4 domain-containing protein [Bacteroidales bacterium]|jgi:23S rRNA pseudouridine2605 synthase|nr:S4 domain-containing protein [Bacteroidales bacterium]
MPHPQQDKKENPGIRLNRYLANSGVCTRREADKLIAKGLVEVDGTIIKEMGYKVMPKQKVSYLGKQQNPDTKKYIIINKPKECILKESNSRDQRSVYDIIEYACLEKVTPVDILDTETTGVLVMTNDTDLAKKLLNNKHEIFHLFLDRDFQDEDLEKLRKGIKIDNKIIKLEAADFANEKDKSEIGIEVYNAEKDTMALLMKTLGYSIKRLDRVLFSGLTKKNVPRGKWRFLSEKEVQFLKMQ